MEGEQSAPPRLGVAEALALMQGLVQQGKMHEAREVGSQAVVPLSLTAAELNLGAKLSEGAESVVYEGNFNGHKVAVKKLRLSTSSDLDRFRSELNLLARLDHPSVVQLVGAKALPPDYMMVLQLQQHNLWHLLYEQAWRPSWEVLIRLAAEVADALAAIHSLGIIHRDLKPSNLLMGADGRVRLSDFGIAVPVAQAAERLEEANHKAFQKGRVGRPTGGFHKQRMVGTLEYMAPEVLLKEPTSTASDVYAFAVTLNELATAVVPFSDCTKDNPEVHTVLEMGYGRQELAAAVAAEGLRPLLPRLHPPGYSDLLAACWKRHPAQRPSIIEVRDALHSIAATLPLWQQGAATHKSPDSANGHGNGHPQVPDAIKHAATKEPFQAHVPTVVVTATADSEPGSPMAQAGAGQLPAGTGAANGDTGRWLAQMADGAAGGYLPTVSAGAFEAIGPRDTMEDRHFVHMLWHPDSLQGVQISAEAEANPAGQTQAGGVADMQVDAVSEAAAHKGTPMTLLGLFDGHRGAQAADYCRSHLPRILAQQCSTSASPQQALSLAFMQLDQEYRQVWEADCASRAQRGQAGGLFPGCTAIAALLVGSQLFVANAGDCRAVLSRGANEVIALSRDHTVILEDERERVQAQGGTVSWLGGHGGWRLGDLGLQVSRCIGDFDYKGKGLTAEPEVMHTTLGPHDGVLILGSDGLWDCISNEEAVGLVRDTVKDPTLCAKRLVMEALARGSADNVTALVVFLCPVSTLERVYGDGHQAFSATATVYGTRRRAGPDLAAGAAADELRETY